LGRLLERIWESGYDYSFATWPERKKAIEEHRRELRFATDKARRKGFTDAVRGKDGEDDYTYLAEAKRVEGLSEVHQHHYHDEIIAAYGEGWRVGRAAGPDREAAFNGWFWGICIVGLVAYLFKLTF
jgi:hypothetical protein